MRHHRTLPTHVMSLSNKLSIADVDLKGKRVLIRVRQSHDFLYNSEVISNPDGL